METLSTPNEIALWTSVVAARHAYASYPCAQDIAALADAAVLELRKRISANAVSAVPRMSEYDLLAALLDAKNAGKRVRVHFGNGDKSEGTLTKSGDMWVLDGHEYFGADEGFADEERAVSVEILEQTPEAIAGGLNEQLRLAAERGQRVRATMADGCNVEGYVIWDKDDAVLPAEVGGYHWCGALEPGNGEHRVVSVEILA